MATNLECKASSAIGADWLASSRLILQNYYITRTQVIIARQDQLDGDDPGS